MHGRPTFEQAVHELTGMRIELGGITQPVALPLPGAKLGGKQVCRRAEGACRCCLGAHTWEGVRPCNFGGDGRVGLLSASSGQVWAAAGIWTSGWYEVAHGAAGRRVNSCTGRMQVGVRAGTGRFQMNTCTAYLHTDTAYFRKLLISGTDMIRFCGFSCPTSFSEPWS